MMYLKRVKWFDLGAGQTPYIAWAESNANEP